jgi:hypothetical protein
MADMKAAGINPLLAGRYDATTPAGAIATMGNVGLAATQGAQQGTASALGVAQENKLREEAKGISQKTYNLALEAAGIVSNNDILKAESQLRELGIAEATSLNRFYNMMMEDDEFYEKMTGLQAKGAVGQLVGIVGIIKEMTERVTTNANDVKAEWTPESGVPAPFTR